MSMLIWAVVVFCLAGSLAGPSQDQVPEIGELVVRLGCAGCPGDSEAFAPADVALGSEEVWILDRFSPFVRAFDFQGSATRRLVLEGAGPGEMQSPYGIHLGHVDSLVLHGSLPATILIVSSRDGSQRARHHLPLRVPLNTAYSAGLDRLYVQSFMFGDDAGRIDTIDTTSGQVTHFLDTEAHTTPDSPDARLETRARLPLASDVAGNLLIGHPWEYSIRRFSRDGNLLFEFGRDVPRPGGPAESALPHFDRFGIQVDAVSGSIWVRTYRGDVARETVFDTFDDDGTFLRSHVVQAPSDRTFSSFAVDNGKLALAYEDADGRNVVEVWRFEHN